MDQPLPKKTPEAGGYEVLEELEWNLNIMKEIGHEDCAKALQMAIDEIIELDWERKKLRRKLAEIKIICILGGNE